MKIFGWLRYKINGNGKEEEEEEEEDLNAAESSVNRLKNHHGLLAIGTFGTKNLEPDHCLERATLDSKSSHSLQMLQQKLSLEDFLDCLWEEENGKDEMNKEFPGNKPALQTATGSIRINLDNSNCIKNTSLSLLLKKALLCSLPAPFPDPRMESSRAEKVQMLRSFLHKKIYPQRHIPRTTLKRYLNIGKDTDSEEEVTLGSRWMKMRTKCKQSYKTLIFEVYIL
ncbi:hypothetical protein M569_00832 [Genlisea aurea]|uniref:Uncharacterized protein n=1 Tax=Genlisea aurea TaxID=192259 RepID=S8D952_9LAMI|nr:hypothetical protein M569_00832 [Genlisea aurea]